MWLLEVSVDEPGCVRLGLVLLGRRRPVKHPMMQRVVLLLRLRVRGRHALQAHAAASLHQFNTSSTTRLSDAPLHWELHGLRGTPQSSRKCGCSDWDIVAGRQ